MKRLQSWARTLGKLILLVWVYLWLGAVYKLFYAQTHDLARFEENAYSRSPISYYQRQFYLESKLRQTWMFGPAFREYIGPPVPNFYGNDEMQEYAKECVTVLSALPAKYPSSLFAGHALADAWQLERMAGSSMSPGREEKFEAPLWARATRSEDGRWRAQAGVSRTSFGANLNSRLVNEFPDNPEVPGALFELASIPSGGDAAYRQLLREYPLSEQGGMAASQLSFVARQLGNLGRARDLKQHALDVILARNPERPGRPMAPKVRMSILQTYLDLAEIELQAANRPEAEKLLGVASRELEKLKAPGAVPVASPYNRFRDDTQSDIPNVEKRLQQDLNELWIKGLYVDLQVPVPPTPLSLPEFEVSGTIVLYEKPIGEVEVVLLKSAGDGITSPRWWQSNSPLRATSDAQGRYRIRGVPAGQYSLSVTYPLRPPIGGGAAITPANPAPGDIVVQGPTTIPVMQFYGAIETVTSGQLEPSGDAVRLQWKPWPGAKGYRIEVQGPIGMRASTRSTMPRRSAFDDITLWQATGSSTQADCPLLALAPDRSGGFRSVSYSYLVTALNERGQPLANNAQPLSVFTLSGRANARMSELKEKSSPPVGRMPGSPPAPPSAPGQPVPGGGP